MSNSVHFWVPTLALVLVFVAVPAEDWLQFRGSRASGTSTSRNLPVEFGPKHNVIWRTPLPFGHSSPVVAGNTIFITGVERSFLVLEKLVVLSLDRATGQVRWKREIPRPRKQELHENNTAASPTPVSDGSNVYAFFGDFGLISFAPDGSERWRLPLGPFHNPMGMGSSPVLAGDILLLLCDQDVGSFLIAVDKETGKIRWKTDRPDYTRGFSTPVIYAPPTGGQEAIVAGSYQMAAYAVDTGKPLWWVRGLSWQVKPTPVIEGGLVFAQSWAAGADTGQQEEIQPFQDTLKRMDANRDGKISRQEVNDPRLANIWSEIDLDSDGLLDERDWKLYRSRRSAQNGILAYRLGGRGDVTESHFVWRYQKSVPNVPSPLIYEGVLYMLKEGGVLTSLEPATGRVLKQGRLTGAVGQYFSSPVAADNKLFAASQDGKVAVVKADAQWEILAINDLEEECYATPAISDGRFYVRTASALYCFGRQ